MTSFNKIKGLFNEQLLLGTFKNPNIRGNNKGPKPSHPKKKRQWLKINFFMWSRTDVNNTTILWVTIYEPSNYQKGKK